MVNGPDKVDGNNSVTSSLPSPEALVAPVVALHKNSWGKRPEDSRCLHQLLVLPPFPTERLDG